jgi:Holliday junction resolvasome RuvABC ATP-dependent DNA helicase subunit
MSLLREGENMNQSDAQPSANYVTCHCQFCGGGIEFDANNLEEGETRVVPCPHCGKETILDAATSLSTEAIPDDPAELENMYSHRVYVHSIKELIEIARQFADKLNIEIDDGALELIARLSVGSPADLLKLLRLVKDFAQENASAKKWITTDLAEKALKPLLEERAKLAAEESRKLLSAAEVSQRNYLTPALFSDFIGQERAKVRLAIAVSAAKKREEALDHILLIGPPGLGKATLAIILAKAMGANVKSISGTTIEQAGDLAGLLTNLEEGDMARGVKAWPYTRIRKPC